MGTVINLGGPIASGKSTLIKELLEIGAQRELRCRHMIELFPEALRDLLETDVPAVDAFVFGHRVQMALDQDAMRELYDLVLVERCFIDHLIFIEALAACERIPKRMVKFSRALVEEVKPPVPDLYVQLSVPVEVAFSRKVARGHGNDDVFSMEFFQELQSASDRIVPEFMQDVIELDWTDFGPGVCREELLQKALASAQPV